jgi:V/A-type H+-transporting ATPase subunit I
LFYGFILGDVVYGIVVVLFALGLRKKFGHVPAVRAAGTVGVYMGVSGMVFGVLYAEYAGNLAEKYFGLHPLWIHRSHDIVALMLVAIIAGTVHVPLALILGVVAGLRHHHIKHAMEKLGLLLGLCAVVLFALNFLEVGVFAASATVFAAGLLFIGCVGLLIWSMGLMALITTLEVISLAGNVLSYCRLMALGLAGVIIADLANVLGTSLNPLIGVPLAALVHVFNIGLAMFSPTLHSLRLNYVEFLPKFYHPDGRSFKPFKKEASW